MKTGLPYEDVGAMTDAELIAELARRAGVGARRVGEAVTTGFTRATQELEAELDRRTADGDPDITADGIVTSADQLPPAAVEPVVVQEKSALLSTGVGAGAGYLVAMGLKKGGVAGALIGGLLGYILKPV